MKQITSIYTKRGCAIVLLLIAGCAPTTPTEGNLFSTVQDLNTGKYEARIQSRKRQLALLKKTQHEYKERLDKLNSELTHKHKQLLHQKHTLQKIQKNKALKLRSINTAKAQQAAITRRLQMLQKSIEMAEKTSNNRQAKIHQQVKLRQLTQERDQLRQQLKALISQD